MALSRDARGDCYGASVAPPGPTVRGRITAVDWGAPIVVRCPGGRARCFEAVLATASSATHVRITLANVSYRDGRGATYKLSRVVLEGVAPRQATECQPPPIATGQLRELDVEPRTSAPWRIIGVR